MVEILQLLEAGLTVTAVTIAAVTYPVAIVSGASPPDIAPLLETIEESNLYSDTTEEP